MKRFVFNTAISVFVIIFLTILGVDEWKTEKVGLAVITFVIAMTNIPVICLHWYQYKHRKISNDSSGIC